MTRWSDEDLVRIGTADEIQISSRQGDGTLRSPVTIWVVRHGDGIYVRSVNGPAASWVRGTQTSHEGQIRTGGVSDEVAFEDAEQDLADEIDGAYRTKYHRYGTTYVDSVVSPAARSATVKLGPR